MRRALVLTAVGGLAAFALAGSLPAASATSMPVTITTVGKLSGGAAAGSGSFKLTGSSLAYSDSGRFASRVSAEAPVRKSPEGLPYALITRTETLKGKHGTLVIRSSIQRFFIVKEDDYALTGTWSIVKGTKRYAGLKGVGALVGITQADPKASTYSDYVFSVRYEGLTEAG